MNGLEFQWQSYQIKMLGINSARWTIWAFLLILQSSLTVAEKEAKFPAIFFRYFPSSRFVHKFRLRKSFPPLTNMLEDNHNRSSENSLCFPPVLLLLRRGKFHAMGNFCGNGAFLSFNYSIHLQWCWEIIDAKRTGILYGGFWSIMANITNCEFLPSTIVGVCIGQKAAPPIFQVILYLGVLRVRFHKKITSEMNLWSWTAQVLSPFTPLEKGKKGSCSFPPLPVSLHISYWLWTG